MPDPFFVAGFAGAARSRELSPAIWQMGLAGPQSRAIVGVHLICGDAGAVHEGYD